MLGGILLLPQRAGGLVQHGQMRVLGPDRDFQLSVFEDPCLAFPADIRTSPGDNGQQKTE